MPPLLTPIDVRLFWLINQHHLPLLDWFFLIITNFGNGWVVTPILILIVINRLPKRVWVKAIVCGTLCLAGSGLISSAIKKSVDRPRPAALFATQTIPAVHVVGERLSAHSFPSGHTTTAFAAALLIGMLLGGWWWLGLILAVLVGYSRVYLGAHFPFDTLAGAMLGSVFGFGVVVVFVRMRWLCIKPQKSSIQRND